MKAIVVPFLFNFFPLTYSNPLLGLSSNSTSDKIHQLYQKHYSAYKKYLRQFNIKHDLSVPEPIRLVKFVEASKMIDAHNVRYEHGLETYEMALNPMSDWIDEEKKRLFGYNPASVTESEHNITNIFSHKNVNALPRAVDYRTVMSPVIDQNPCQVCYIVAALSTLEGHIALKTGKPVEQLSIQNVMDCSGLEACNGDGGFPNEVWKYVAKAGVISAKDDPFMHRNNLHCFSGRKRKLPKLRAVTLPHSNELALKVALASRGPVAVGISASLNSLMYYRGGIYYDPKCPNGFDDLNHAVVVVGYGEENGRQYFIIKNSWGESWGEEGYARFQAGVFACGLGRHNFLPII